MVQLTEAYQPEAEHNDETCSDLHLVPSLPYTLANILFSLNFYFLFAVHLVFPVKPANAMHVKR
jgi:hypothetical protein